MRVTSPIADAMSAVADALRGVYNGEERLVLARFTHANNKASYEIIGEVYDGWEKVERTFEDGAQEPPTVVKYYDDEWTCELLQTVVAWGIFTDESAITLEGCKPEGIARFGDEIGMRLRSTGRLAGTYPLTVDVDNLLLASGDHLLLEQTGNLLLAGGA